MFIRDSPFVAFPPKRPDQYEFEGNKLTRKFGNVNQPVSNADTWINVQIMVNVKLKATLGPKTIKVKIGNQDFDPATTTFEVIENVISIQNYVQTIGGNESFFTDQP